MRFSSCRRRDLNLFNVPSPMKRHHIVLSYDCRAMRGVLGFLFVVDGSLLTVLTSVKTLGRNLRFLHPAERSSTCEPKTPQAVLGSSPMKRHHIVLSCDCRAMRGVLGFLFVVGGSLLTVLTSVKTLGRNLRFLRPAERSSTREPECHL